MSYGPDCAYRKPIKDKDFSARRLFEWMVFEMPSFPKVVAFSGAIFTPKVCGVAVQYPNERRSGDEGRRDKEPWTLDLVASDLCSRFCCRAGFSISRSQFPGIYPPGAYVGGLE